MPNEKDLKIVGRLTDAAGLGLPDAEARVVIVIPGRPDQPTAAVGRTSGDGTFEIVLRAADVALEGEANVRVDFVAGGVEIARSEPRRVGRGAIRIEVQGRREADERPPRDEDSERVRRVFGTVRDEFGEPIAGGVVEAFDRDLRAEESLGRSEIRDGRYEVKYHPAQFRRSDKADADLSLKVVGPDGADLFVSPIRFNAPVELEWDLAVGGGGAGGTTDWDAVTATLTPLLEDLSPLDLREDAEHQDITFLVGETDLAMDRIVDWVVAHRLAANAERQESRISPEALYAFLRQGQPATTRDTVRDDLRDPDRLLLLDDSMLERAAGLDVDVQRMLLTNAIDGGIVPRRLRREVDEVLEALHAVHLRYVGGRSIGGGKGTIGEILELSALSGEQRDLIVDELQAHRGPLRQLWEKFTTDERVPPETVGRVRLSLELGALTRNHVALVDALLTRFDAGTIGAKRDLARLDRAGWTEILQSERADGTAVGVPVNIDGETPEEQLDLYAGVLVRQFEQAYPTAAFAANLTRSTNVPIAAREDVVTFLDANPEFHLDRYRIDHYVTEKPDALKATKEPEVLIRELKTVQRVFRLEPTTRSVEALLTRSIDSSQQIYFMGQTKFLEAMADSGINRIDVKQMYRKAELTYAFALATFADLNTALNGALPAALPTMEAGAEAEAKIEALPNLRSLFGTLDYCECTHCRSVYSPAAYFVDVLRFLGLRATNGTTINAGKSVRDVLLTRRPDLGEIELSCENTDTPLPYIDLVNEVLEDAVSPPVAKVLASAIEPDLVAGPASAALIAELDAKSVPLARSARVFAPDSRGAWVVRDEAHAYRITKSATGEIGLLPTHQTFLTKAEVRANPEYRNAEAYERLRTAVFPFDLPFDLAWREARAYLDHLGVSHPKLLETFRRPSAGGSTPTDVELDAARLSITDEERAILTNTPPSTQPWAFWGLAQTGNDVLNPKTPTDPTTNLTGTWIDVLSSVDVVLHRTGLTYRQLLALLDLPAVNPDGAIRVNEFANPNAANCDTSTFRLEGLDPDGLGRIQRFVRFWRRLGCEMWELDLLLPDTDPTAGGVVKPITDGAISEISRLDTVRRATGLDWRQVLSLYRGIDDAHYVDHSSEGTPPIQSLYERLFRNKLVDAASTFPSDPGDLTGPIGDRIPGILAANRLREPDLALIVEAMGVPTTATISLATLTGVHRIALLARAAQLGVDDFLRLNRLWGADAFADPAATKEFLDAATLVAESGFSVRELDYLLSDAPKGAPGIALEDKAIRTLLEDLRAALQKVSDDALPKADETDEAYVRAKLGRLEGLSKDADQATALAIIDGTWSRTAAERDAFIDAHFASFVDAATAKVQLGDIAAGLTPDALQTEVDERFAFVQPAIRDWLLRTGRQGAVRDTVAPFVGLDVPSMMELLVRLRLSGSTTPLLATFNDDDLTERTADGTAFARALDETSFPEIYRGARLLHKVALLVSRFGMTSDEVRWWLAGSHADDLGWIRADALPAAATDPAVDFDRWRSMLTFHTWRDRLRPADFSWLDLLDRLLDPAIDSTTAIANVATSTGWSEQDLTTLVEAFGWLDTGAGVDTVKAELRRAASLRRLTDAFGALRMLGVDAARAIGWSVPNPSTSIADALKAAVKARYDLGEWERVIQPLQDEFRNQKRAALVSWLVANPNRSIGQNWTDADGLYKYYLIDVQMDACMLTSRIVQASASAQLLVQRCLMNLEVDVVAQTDLDAKWKQWKWMKRYRVWEANRKVFLYPENWLEPQLRDEKSRFFLDLEQELRQNDVTNESAEQAYLTYLEKLDRVANLEIRAMHLESTSQDESVLHVFGRTRTAIGPEYHYRRRINNARWTAWEPVEQEISGNHLVAGVHNRRLYLFWPQFLDKADDPPPTMLSPAISADTAVPQPQKYWEIRLFWSELKKGKWTAKALSDGFEKAYQGAHGFNRENVTFRTRLRPQIEVRLFGSALPTQWAPSGSLWFEKLSRQLTLTGNQWETLSVGPFSQYANNLIRHNSSDMYFYYGAWDNEPWGQMGEPLPITRDAPSIRVLQGVRPVSTHSVIDSTARSMPGGGSFFLWDPARTYFVDFVYSSGIVYDSQGQPQSWVTSNFKFFIHYHPFVELFIRELNIWGLRGLLNRRIQVEPTTIANAPPAFDFAAYQPDPANAPGPYPVEDVDFSYMGAYSVYNWELFFHVPLFIADRLRANQRFEEAIEWFHYIFDPTNTDTAVADPNTPQQRYWITKPFYLRTKADYYKQKIESILLAIAKGDAEMREQVKEWRDNPFKPHLIARMREVAYQKNVLIKYIQTLIDWGDQLFRQESLESLTEATQLYVLAKEILGPRPASIPRKVDNPVKTFYQLQAEGIDDFGNVVKEIENLLPPSPSTPSAGTETPEMPHIDLLYFCIPNNANLLTLWDTVEDRLYKVRHCMNIEGVVRQLPLFAPPIDPGLLVKAAAAGLDIGAAIADLNAAAPLYRFSFMIQRAYDFCNDVKALGNALTQALERGDAESLAILRSTHEQVMLARVREVRNRQIDEAVRALEALEESRHVVEERQAYYSRLARDGLNEWETASLVMTGGAIIAEIVATVLNAIATGTNIIPEVNFGASGFGGSPHVTATIGGHGASRAIQAGAAVSTGVGSALQLGAAMSATIGAHNRRAEEWRHLLRLAEKELPQIDKQVLAADIRRDIAVKELANQETQIEQAKELDEFLRSKYTNTELYDWMVGEVATTYFQSYQLAYDLAKRAERSFRYELGLTDSGYIQFGYWDSLRKGLLSGDRLMLDLRRLEAAYLEANRREYEVTKHISLAQLDPVALLKLRTTGECFVDIPETAFDMDFPGHYFRRIKTISMSVPCTVGPYTTLGATLTMTSNSVRKDPTLSGGKYARDMANEDLRFRDEIAAVQSIAVSEGQADDGLFELNFRDERYLPFEGAGAISSWHVRLNADLPQFDFGTIADVIIHMSYTAREAGALLRSKAVEAMHTKLSEMALAESRQGLYRVFDLRREFPDDWYRFLHPATAADDQVFTMADPRSRLPYFTAGFGTVKAKGFQLIARMADGQTYEALLSPVGETPADVIRLAPLAEFGGLHHGAKDLTGAEVPFGPWTLSLRLDGAADFRSLPPEAIEDLFLAVNYVVA